MRDGEGSGERSADTQRIDAAFHGLSSPTRVEVAKAASNVAGQTVRLTTSAVAEGGRRAGKAFRHGVLSVGAFLIGIIFLIAGDGAPALIFFLLSVALLVRTAFALVTSQSSSA